MIESHAIPRVSSCSHPVAQVVGGASTGDAAVEFALAIERVCAGHLVGCPVPEQQPDCGRVIAHPLCQSPRLQQTTPQSIRALFSDTQTHWLLNCSLPCPALQRGNARAMKGLESTPSQRGDIDQHWEGAGRRLTSYHFSLRRSMKESGAPSMESMRQFSYTGDLAQKLATSFRLRSAASSAVRRCLPAAAAAPAPPGLHGCIPSCASSNSAHSCIQNGKRVEESQVATTDLMRPLCHGHCGCVANHVMHREPQQSNQAVSETRMRQSGLW